MTELSRLVRRVMIQWQLRSLEHQAESIIEARQHALARLMEIQRERYAKKEELWRSYSNELGAHPAQ